MNKRNRIGLSIFGGLLTSMTVYLLLKLTITDYTYSVIPGWHTTIWTGESLVVAMTIIVLTSSIVTYLIFKGILRLLKTFWPTMDKN